LAATTAAVSENTMAHLDLEVFKLSLARKCQVDLATRRARAKVWIEGLRQLNRRVNKQKANALKLCAAAVGFADDATMTLVEQHCEEHERAIGREDVATSPFRADGPIAMLKRMQANHEGDVDDLPGQLMLFGGEEVK
jgi:hypothetical protein